MLADFSVESEVRTWRGMPVQKRQPQHDDRALTRPLVCAGLRVLSH